MHVLFVAHSSTTAGAERTLVALAAAATAAGDRVTISIPRIGGINSLIVDHIPDATVVVQNCHWWMGDRHRSFAGILRTIQSLLETVSWLSRLRSVNPDIVIVGSTVTPAPLLAARLRRVPTAVILGESIRSNPTLRSILPKSLIVRAIYAWSTVTVAVSEYAAAQYHRPTIVEFPPMEKVAGVRDQATKYLQPAAESSEHLTAVILGTLSPEKGQFDLIDVAMILANRRIAIRIEVYGDAEASILAKFERQRQTQRVAATLIYRGLTSDPLGVLSNADVSLVCSRNEAYGRITAESILVGTPVIGYNLGGTREILRDGGGVLVDPSPSAMANVLEHLAVERSHLSSIRAGAELRANDHRGFGDADSQWRKIRSLLEVRCRRR